MPLPDLEPESLYVFVFGPGTGEAVVLRAPPDDWIVIDGCRAGGAVHALELLRHYGAETRVRAVVLTHPHTDHAKGIADVLDDVTQREPATWPRIGLVLPPWMKGAGNLSDMPDHLQGGVAEEAISAILARWEAHPPCRWNLHRGDLLSIGGAQVEPISPSRARRAAFSTAFGEGRRFPPNAIATALLVTWASHRIVLGSDLDDGPGEGWDAALQHAPTAASPILLKVPHHGSRHAQHGGLLPNGNASTLLATPFASQGLPRFETGHGAEWLLQRSDALHLSAMPREFAKQGVAPTTQSRAQLVGPGLAHTRAPGVGAFPHCGVVARIDVAGTVSVDHFPGSLQVHP